MSRIGADLEERRHVSDELEVIADHRSAADILLRVGFNRPVRLPEGSEVMEFDFRAFDGECLRVIGHENS